MTRGDSKCPVCGKPPAAEYRPFCSKRCADVDLQRWFSGAYTVPAEEAGSSAPNSEPDPDV